MTFIHGVPATTSGPTEDDLAEAYAIIGVEPGGSWAEIESVHLAKIKYAHPDGTQDPEEHQAREERASRLNAAHDRLEQAVA